MEHKELHSDGHDSQQLPATSGEKITPFSPDRVLSNILARFGLGTSTISEGETVDGLLSSLEDSQWQIRTAAARKLGALGSPKAINSLITMLVRDEVPAARAAAARALGDIEEGVPEGPLVDALEDGDEDVRTAAAQSLGALGSHLSQAAIQGLVARTLDDDEYVRAAAVSAVGSLENRTPLELLEAALGDVAWPVREAAVLAMGRQGDRANIEALENMWDDESESVSKAVAYALGEIYEEISGSSEDPSAGNHGNEAPAKGESSTSDQNTPPQLKSFTSGDPLSTEPGKNNVRSSGNVSFDALVPGDFVGTDTIPLIAQALDNQWLPRTLLRAMLKGKVSFKEAERYLEGLVRTEYMRSLINGERVIINRAYLYNNPVLFRDYLQEGESRAVFKKFLESGVIIPFLLYEQSPAEPPEFAVLPQGFAAWQKICEEVLMHCIRFSWVETTQQIYVRNFMRRYQEFVQNAEARDTLKYAVDLGLGPGEESLLSDILAQMHNLSAEYYRTHKQERVPYITRNILYQCFVTAGENPAERRYDGTKPLSGAIKQLLDLAYNGYLADALNGYLLSPVDSPTRLVLQDWEAIMRERAHITGETLIQMLRNNAFTLLHEGLYLKSMGLLTLRDVEIIRGTEQWATYIRSLRKLLQQPVLFGDLAPDLYNSYVRLASEMTSIIAQRDRQRSGDLKAPWEPSVRIIATVGGASLSVVWNKEGAFYRTEGSQSLPYTTTENGDAPFTMRLIIGDSSSSSTRSQAKLFSSIEIMKGKMPDAIREWGKLMREFGRSLKFREYLPDHAEQISAPTINEQEHL